MDKSRKVVVAIVGVVAALAIGAGVVWAGSSDDKPLQGNLYDRATEAALEHVGGGTVIETELGDDGAAYGVEIRKDDGTVVEVNLDENFEVIGEEADDDGANDTEEPGDDG
jgi:flagellar biosynthesis/type III secretory pathway M-ring protein FliF/YscJ